MKISTDFVLFGVAHISTLLVGVALAYCVYRLGLAVWGKDLAGSVAIVLAVMLLGLEGLKTWQGLAVYEQPWQELLPLHLCRISSYLCALMLVLRSYRLFEVVYFWGVGGSIAAMLTPDLSYGFPHPLYLGFFIGHGLVLSSVLFAIGGYCFKPRLGSIGLTAIVSAVYMSVVAVINLALDTNYLYLSHQPETLTLYRFLGPWPWYIVTVWAIGVAACFMLYLPFVARRKSRVARRP